ncbi:MAG: helix-turn-helix transcriptional regulator [Lachnospiraceae bacterium]|nr:helix-turn-helix transcriptional regulator [Lachnospiraceae bacterium]
MGKGKQQVPSEKGLKSRQEVVRELKRIRQQKEMTQQELAELMGTQKSNISRLESGRYNPSLDFLIRIFECLGKTVSLLVK